MPSKKLPSSFRDPSGFLFNSNAQLYRQINNQYKESYEFLDKSGLLKNLQEDHLLINHKEANSKLAQTSDAYKVIKPEKIPFISYPYELCFSELKDAAALTLEIQKTALGHGLSLRDASAYNIQFLRGKPIHIDTLSF